MYDEDMLRTVLNLGMVIMGLCGVLAGAAPERIMFMGDSITHGVQDMTYRWPVFKTLVDNGVKAEILGPRSGFYNRPKNSDFSPAGITYRGVAFPNVHLAQASGRTHNILAGSNKGMTGVNYGGHSVKSAVAAHNCDTYICLLGTNDLISDAGFTPQHFARKMQNLLGGKVTYRAGQYQYRPDGKNLGNMGAIAEQVLQDAGDSLYILAVPAWTRHSNNNEPERHDAVGQYNRLLEQWVQDFGKKHPACRVHFVDVNEGLVDIAAESPFYAHEQFFTAPGRDGLHPGEQGSLIMAGHVARALGVGGRTAGLPRSSATQNKKFIGKKPIIVRDAPVTLKEKPFSSKDGYTVLCWPSFGNGEDGGWKSAEAGCLSITVGDESRSGTLRISEAHIMWGDKVLYCRDNSQKGRAPLRVVWHHGNAQDNIPQGYYIWLGDMLIGQALPASAEKVPFGVQIKAKGGAATVRHLRYSDTSYAP